MQNKPNDTILVLPSWYPNKLDKFAGDFIQRHVQAIALYVPQYVIHFVKDELGEITKDSLSEINNYDNYTEEIIYYSPSKTGIKYLDKWFSFRMFSKLYKKTVLKYLKENGHPPFVHVHVALKAGLISYWIKNKFKIPYIISEHWTIYLAESDYKIEQLQFFYRKYLSKILQQASEITVVSEYLGNAIQKLYPFSKYVKIPNVVDLSLFYPIEKVQVPGVRFIHASLMNYQKNVEDILHAAQILKNKGFQFTIELFGPIKTSIEQLILCLKLNNHVFLRGEVSQVILAKEMQVADALISFSRFETFGCVIIEAHACGIPVIASDLPIFKETITSGLNGLFAKESDAKDLAEVMIYFNTNKHIFNKAVIAKSVEKYNYLNIGKEFDGLYKLLK